MKSPKVQTFVVHEITNILSEKFNAKISIESVDYAFFNKLRLNKVYVEDQHGDTLLYSGRIYASLRGYNLGKRFISIGTTELDNGKFYLKQDSTGVLNLKFILDALASKDTTKKKAYSFKVRNFKLVDFAFKYHKWKPQVKPYGMNYTDLDIRHIYVDLRNIRIVGSKITAKMENLSAYEKCGFLLRHLGADVDFSPKEIKLSNATINTPNSLVKASYIIFRFNGFADWKDYVHKVKMDALFNNAFVDFKTISYFAPTLSKWNFKGILDGRVRGPVCNLRSSYLEFKTGDSTKLSLNFSIVGLPKAEETVWRGNVHELTSNGRELGQTIKTFVGTHGESVAGIMAKLGKLKLNAYFSGKFSAFNSSAQVFSSIGNIVASLDTKASNGHTNAYALNVSTSNLNLGRIIDSKEVGAVTGTLKSSGATEGRLIKNSSTEANFNSVYIHGYDYKDIALTLNREGKLYDYLVRVNSRDADFTCAGSYNFSSLPSRTMASFKVNHVNLHRLNFTSSDTITSIKGLFNVDFTGTSIDNINGSATLHNATFSTHSKSVLVGMANVYLKNSSTERELRIESDLADGVIKGNSSLRNLGLAVNHFTKLYFPAIAKAEIPQLPTTAKGGSTTGEKAPAAIQLGTQQQYFVNVKVKKVNDVLGLFIPRLKVEKSSTLLGSINTSNNTFDIKLISPLLQLGSSQFSKVNLQAVGTPGNMRTSLTCGKYQIKSLALSNINLDAMGAANRINTTVSFNNNTKENHNEGEVKFITTFEKKTHSPKPHIEVNFLKSLLTVNNTPWKIGQALVSIDSTTIGIEDFKIINQQQKIAVAGKISKNRDDQLHFIINNFDIQNFKSFFQKSGYDIRGALNGIATLKNIYESPMLFSNVKFDDAYINGQSVGSPELVSSWDEVSRKVSVLSTNTIDDKEVYRLSGTISPETKDLELDVKVNQLRPFLLEPFTKGIVSNMKGNISGDLRITGTTDTPIINGIAYLNSIQAKVDFLNTTYNITAPIVITPTELSIKNDTLTDALGNLAFVNASVTHKNLKNFKFNINIQPKNLLALNTTAKQNKVFYGTAYASGLVQILGNLHDLEMRINAVTEKNSKVYIPLNNRTQIQDQSFITFISQKEKNDNNAESASDTPSMKQEKKPKSNLKIYLELQVTPDAEAQILLDPGSGNILKAQGTSNLSMEVNPSSNIFQIRGNYTIQKGNFRFSLLNLTSKDFSIDAGSTITWTGNPSNATINVTARHKVRTSLGPILVGLDQNNTQRYNVDCKLMLDGMLLNPTIKLGVELPDAEASTQTLVQAALNTESQMQKQFVSLLWFGQFFPEQTTASNENPIGTYASKGMATDLLFNQLANLVSQISNSLNFGIKYTPSTATTTQEYEFSGSYKFKDWLTVNGTIDVADNTKSTGRGVAGDYDAEVRLDKKDRVKFKMFSRQKQDYLLNSTTQSRQGVGIFFQNQFNSFGDLFRKKKKNSAPTPPKPALLPETKSKNDSTKTQKGGK
ncbi:translocation/assembly module TamB domain-containing protein [uncultured Acetobacteroides sp.]|uniref:translocation/assembly module TamB domain-containing protein n=1 Tax=uncultured Acetobacteroides sp. TaxID=1760811 RepID=UPI0029F58EB9|nr:translocation/assembly module TamB domain-containing protein [uncultured Acetobacteroides sp.]